MVEMTKQMQEVIDAYAKLGPLPVDSVSPEIARQLPELRDAVLGVINQHGAKRLFVGVVEPVQAVEHILIPGPESQILARVYRPSNEVNLPVTLYFHGGGFVFANLNTYDSSCRALCNAANTIVVSVAYRQAPEHKFPAAPEDAFAAYRWMLLHAASIGGDAKHIAVAGESAGGNLAAVICLMAKNKGIAQPVHQLLVYPVVDNNFTTPSYQEHADAKPLNRNMMKWFMGHYTDASKPGYMALPMKAENFAGLAPATIITAEIDPLCWEGEHFAEVLRGYEVPVLSQRFKGVTHEFFGMGAVVDEAKHAVRVAAGELNRAFGRETIREAYFEQPIAI